MFPRLRLPSVQMTIVELALHRPRAVIAGVLLITLALGGLIVRVETDTDPENMLPRDNPVRALNRAMRADFGTRDMIALGIVDERGVVNSETLGATSRLIEDIKTLDGVVAEGVVSFKAATDVPVGLLSQPDVDRIASAVAQNPLLAGRVLSPDGQALAIYIPLERKEVADSVSSSLKSLLKRNEGLGTASYYLAGLPLAEDAFGRDMFLQMALFAPVAGFVLFLVMLYFFRRPSLVVASMAVAMLSVIWTMGLLIGSGFQVHIMTSMIPVFLMPIAIAGSIHVLSEFFDRYRHYQDRQTTLHAVYQNLSTPIFYAALTTAVAFASFLFTPIPPVRVFGLFVALGVLGSWLLTLLFVPAFVMLLSEEGLRRSLTGDIERSNRVLTGGLRWMGRFAARRPRIILAAFALVAIAAIPGVMQITINDNPVRWFKGGSDIRVATDTLSRHFPGTYNASLLLETGEAASLTDPSVARAVAGLQDFWEDIDVVGQTTSYVDVVAQRTNSSRAVPTTRVEIEEALRSAASSGGGMLGSLVTADYRKANMQLLLRDGDNKTMKRVVDRTEAYLQEHPLPAGLRTAWAGETYLNKVWQDKMVWGMMVAFLSTVGVVFLLMVLLLRSLRWALLSVIPMGLTILLVYGVLGFSGKNYDMPIAVLSALVLGIGIDFAIHFIQRYRQLLKERRETRSTLDELFEEPARAITRNALIIAIGFVPMLFASLVPYIVVGAFMTSIMFLTWLATLLLLPAVITVFAFRTPDDATTPEVAHD